MHGTGVSPILMVSLSTVKLSTFEAVSRTVLSPDRLRFERGLLTSNYRTWISSLPRSDRTDKAFIPTPDSIRRQMPKSAYRQRMVMELLRLAINQLDRPELFQVDKRRDARRIWFV